MEREKMERTPTLCQAENMSRNSGIELTDEELNLYIYARQSREPDYFNRSDQYLLHMCISPEKQVVFEQFFNNIFL